MPPERSPQRDAAIAATLSHVPFDGWTYRALRHGLAGIGASPEDAAQLFPRGAGDMIEAFGDWADRQMEQAVASLDPALPLHRRVRSVIALRLEQNRPYKEAIRRAVAQLALPGHARLAASHDRPHRRCDLARGRRPHCRLQLVHQASDPRCGLDFDPALLAARHQRG